MQVVKNLKWFVLVFLFGASLIGTYGFKARSAGTKEYALFAFSYANPPEKMFYLYLPADTKILAQKTKGREDITPESVAHVNNMVNQGWEIVSTDYNATVMQYHFVREK